MVTESAPPSDHVDRIITHARGWLASRSLTRPQRISVPRLEPIEGLADHPVQKAGGEARLEP